MPTPLTYFSRLAIPKVTLPCHTILLGVYISIGDYEFEMRNLARDHFGLVSAFCTEKKDLAVGIQSAIGI